MEETLKVCPLCEAEYQPNVAECVDCHTPLIPKAEYDRAREPLPFSDDLVEIRTDMTSWIKQLADVLVKAGIRYHVLPAGAVSDGRPHR